MTQQVLEITGDALTDRGCQRETNEDCVAYLRPAVDGVWARKGVLAIVADGMGGHVAGELASRVAVEVVGRCYYESECESAEALAEAFREANRTIYERSRESDSLSGMGTTCTALVLNQEFAYSAHVGDSRLYLLRDEQIYLMTQDHSEVMELVRQGLLTPDQARQHENRNVIIRSLGSRPEVDIDIWQQPFPLRKGDAFLLCSDGLYGLVDNEEICAIIGASEPSPACRELIEIARARGGPDNISTAILKLRHRSQAGGTARPTRETGELA
jgi:PPM family protein phosphatase